MSDNTPGRDQHFRAELRRWITHHHPGEEPAGEHERFAFGRTWQRRLYEAGYVGLDWPVEHGGRGLGPTEQAIFYEELVAADLPPPINFLALSIVAPVIMAFGTSEQQQRWLPGMLDGSEIWCQGFSEPEAGSDLASLRTRAVPDGAGGYLVSGQKVWTSLAHESAWCMLLARTDPAAPKHEGLTMLCVRLASPGVNVAPLVQITGEADFSELFLDAVPVPATDVLGAPGSGWRVAGAALEHERVGIALADAMELRRGLERLVDLLSAQPTEVDAATLQRLARVHIANVAVTIGGKRTLERATRTGRPGAEANIAKLQFAQANQALTELAADVLGEHALTGDGLWTRRLLRSRANSLEGGTTEILKSVVAERVLGLPRNRP